VSGLIRYARRTRADPARGTREGTLHPRSRVQMRKENAHEHTGSAEHPAFPAQWLYGLLRALPVNGSFATVAPRSLLLANLTPAPRRQDHTTSPYAIRRLRLARSASTASHRAFVTMRNAPHLR
jgi:hypothetical protein